MIWYILYPFRGTTEVPVLGPTHPLRSAFTRYGRYAARHVVTTLLISVTAATVLIYPIPFLFSTDFANGASNLPRHVWTAAQALDRSIDVEPDVVMRSIWVHGSYMDALNRDVLLGALELQDELLGSTLHFDPRQPSSDDTSATSPGSQDDDYRRLDAAQRDTLHIVNGLTNESWFFHSPLLYWSCSAENIILDPDIVATVNQRKSQPTSVNVTLRHSMVFSGKRFSDRRLVAADALVITLVHSRDSPVAQQWITRAQSLPSRTRDKWAIYPRGGLSLSSQLYEFQFMPISTKDSILLALAYALTLIYCLVSLSKLRAVKSKFGLSITVITQIAVSIMSSFTVCAILDVDLSRIPRAAYPLAVLSLSLENIFRLINAVILTPAEDSTCNRVGHAFGETVHICLASSAQNVLIFWGLSYVVAPGVSAFCVFAIVVIFFDFFYLATFFLSVLSVDVRRTELGESLAKASLKHRHRCGGHTPQSWSEAMLQGKIALSTRISGTIVTVTFVLIAQWHFFVDGTMNGTLGRLFNGHESGDSVSYSGGDLADLHQARSPTSWLRLQDHETAREVIQVVKPLAHSYIAEVYEPLVFVVKGSDRMPHSREGLLPPAAYDFIRHQFVPFAAVAVFTVAAVRLLTNYLLWDARPEPGSDSEGPDECPLSVMSFEGGHSLDVVRIIASNDGHVVSIGLDRRIHVWDVRHELNNYEITALEQPEAEFLPVLAMTIDEDSRWLALISSHNLLLWNFAKRRWAPSTPIDLAGQKPEAVFFVSSDVPQAHSLVIVHRGGTMTQIWPASMEQREWTICTGPLTCASLIAHKHGLRRPVRHTVLTASRDRYMQITSQKDDDGWASRCIGLDSGCDDGGGEVHQVVGIPMLDAALVARRDSVLLLDLRCSRVTHTFLTESIQPRSLKLLHTRRHRSQPGPSGLTSLTLVYSNGDTEDCVMQAYFAPDDTDDDILRVQESAINGSHIAWLDAVQTTKHIHCPGVWEVLPGGYVIGVRHKLKRQADTAGGPRGHSGLRHRRCMRGSLRQGQGCGLTWEVWIASQPCKADVFETRPLLKSEDAAKHLLISQMGPLAKVGRNAVAVGFGTSIKMVTVGHGHNHFADLDDGDVEDPLLHTGSRRRKTGVHKGRAHAPSVPAQESYGRASELGGFKCLSASMSEA